MRPSAETSARVAVAAALAALVAWSFWQRWTMLTASPFPVGIDGYFYPIQLRSLLEHGTLAYPASPLGFWLMAPLAALTNPITGAKLGAALFGALIALPAYGVGTQLGRSRGAGLVAAALATTSAGSAFLTFEFVKNGIGLTVALTALWLGLRAIEKPSRGRVIAALVGIAAAVLAHKMAAGLVLAVLAPAALAAKPGAARVVRIVVRILVAVIAVLVVIGLAAPGRFLSPDDVKLVARMWTTSAHWDAPALVLPRDTLMMGHEAAIGGVLALFAVVLLVHDHARRRHPQDGVHGAAWAIIGLALVISLPWLDVRDPMGLTFRLRIAAFVPMALCGAIVAGRLLDACRDLVQVVRESVRDARRADERDTSRADRAYVWLRDGVLAVVALAIVVAMPRDRTQGKIVAHPAMVAAVQALDGRIPAGATAIVPERHIMFMVGWYTRAPSRLTPGDVPREQRWRVMPLAFIGEGSPLDTALTAARREPSIASPTDVGRAAAPEAARRSIVAPRGTHPRHPNGLVLVPEATWEWLLEHLPPDARDYFARWPTI